MATNTELTLTIKADLSEDGMENLQVLLGEEDVTRLVVRDHAVGDAPGTCCLMGVCNDAWDALVNDLAMQKHFETCLEGCADCRP